MDRPAEHLAKQEMDSDLEKTSFANPAIELNEGGDHHGGGTRKVIVGDEEYEMQKKGPTTEGSSFRRHSTWRQSSKRRHSMKPQPRNSVFGVPSLGLTDKEIAEEVRSVKLSLLFVNIAGMLTVSYVSILGITTSVFQEGNLGYHSLTVIAVSQVLSALLLLTYVSKVFGLKNMIKYGMVMILSFVGACFYPTWGTLMPLSFVLGIGITILFTTIYAYSNVAGYWYCKLTGANKDSLFSLIVGCLNSSLTTGALLGNILVYFILESTLEPSVGDEVHDTKFRDFCGAEFCNEDLSGGGGQSNGTVGGDSMPVDSKRFYILVSVLGVLQVVGIVLTFFAHDFDERLGIELHCYSEYWPLTLSTFKLLKDPRGSLLVVAALYLGLEESFVYAEFTMAYVTCTLGIPQVGLVMFSFGLAQMLSSLGQWPLVKCFGRPAVVSAACLMHLACFIVLLLLPLDEGDLFFRYLIIAAMWGAADCFNFTCVYALCGLMFEEDLEGGFTVCNLWWSFGFLVAYGSGQFLCVRIKLFILMAAAVVALAAYLGMEFRLRKKKAQDGSK